MGSRRLEVEVEVSRRRRWGGRRNLGLGRGFTARIGVGEAGCEGLKGESFRLRFERGRERVWSKVAED